MSDDRTGFYWHGRDSGAGFERCGGFGLEEVLPFLRELTEEDACLLISLPRVNLDFSTVGRDKIETEIHDTEGMSIIVVKTAVAEEILCRAYEEWDGDMLSNKLADLPTEWL